MKKLISKIVNRYTAGLSLALASGAALAQSSAMSGGMIAAGLMGVVVVAGAIAVSANNSDNNDTAGTTVYNA